MNTKSDAAQIKQVLDNLKKQGWVHGTERRWWPHFLFHYTDIRNAAQILQQGQLLSRSEAEASSLELSSGSDIVLAKTNIAIRNCVRFYFRPKTPTQYYSEGLHSAQTLATSSFPDAHCPVPIFLLFDAVSILSLNETQFSDGNLSSNSANIFSTADELSNLPWKKIYHNGYIDHANSREIVLRRHAEAIVPNSIDLKYLRYIYCRSTAERETLMHLLPLRLRNQYSRKIVATARSELYFRQRTYVDRVWLSSENIFLQFSPETISTGPFNLRIEFIEPNKRWYYESSQFNLSDKFRRRFDFRSPISTYEVKILMDGHLVYANVYDDAEILF